MKERDQEKRSTSSAPPARAAAAPPGIGLNQDPSRTSTLAEWRARSTGDRPRRRVPLGCKHGVSEIEARRAPRRLGDQHLVDLGHHRRRQHGRLQLGQGGRARSSANRWRCIAPSRATTSAATRCIYDLHRHADPRQVPRPLRPGPDAAKLGRRSRSAASGGPRRWAGPSSSSPPTDRAS